MKSFLRRLVLFVALVTVVPVFAASRVCGASSLSLSAFSSPADQEIAAHRAALELGAENVQTAVTPRHGNIPRYLVLVTVCDSYVTIPNEGHVSVRSQSVVVPDDSPYLWESVPTIGMASDLIALHADAAVSGVQSTGNGSLAVYWSRETR